MLLPQLRRWALHLRGGGRGRAGRGQCHHPRDGGRQQPRHTGGGQGSRGPSCVTVSRYTLQTSSTLLRVFPAAVSATVLSAVIVAGLCRYWRIRRMPRNMAALTTNVGAVLKHQICGDAAASRCPARDSGCLFIIAASSCWRGCGGRGRALLPLHAVLHHHGLRPRHRPPLAHRQRSYD